MERRARATAETIKERFPNVNVEDWLASNPYQDREMMEAWRRDLVEIGLIDA